MLDMMQDISSSADVKIISETNLKHKKFNKTLQNIILLPITNKRIQTSLPPIYNNVITFLHLISELLLHIHKSSLLINIKFLSNK